jgi:hypothetical protein
VNLDLSKPISTDEAIKYQVVCFCDIPEPDLAIHVTKYSKFGLAFPRGFLVEKGASPVFYIAKEAPVPVTMLMAPPEFRARIDEVRRKGGYTDRALLFDTSFRAIVDLLCAVDGLNADSDGRFFKEVDSKDFESRIKVLLQLSDDQVSALRTAIANNKQFFATLRTCTSFLLNDVFSFVKGFDTKLPFDDEQSYYMEREWRIPSNVQFSLSDVSRVFFPSKYAKRFRAELPSYTGQISFIE